MHQAYGEWSVLATASIFESDTNSAFLNELGVPGIGWRGWGICITIRQFL